MSEEKYEITKEAILAMAEKCPEAKAVLKAGFPQAFELPIPIDLEEIRPEICTYKNCSLYGKGYTLIDSHNWHFERSSRNQVHLIPDPRD